MNLSPDSAPFVAENATKSYPGHLALDALSLEIPAGHVVGLLGRNGAGKTTLIHLAAGLTLPSSGTCRTFGRPTYRLDSPELSRLGLVQQESRFIEWMTVRQHLDFTASFYANWDRDLQHRLTEALELPVDRKLAVLSAGDRQKVGILLGVCHRPAFLLLDEPMSSLDPIARTDMLDFLLERLRDDGCTVLISSHLLTDVEKIVDWVVFLKGGRLVENSSFDVLQESFAEWTVTAPEGAPARRLRRALRPLEPGTGPPGAPLRPHARPGCNRGFRAGAPGGSQGSPAEPGRDVSPSDHSREGPIMNPRVHLRLLRPVRSLIGIASIACVAFGASHALFRLDWPTSRLLGFAVTLPLVTGFYLGGAAHEPMHRPFILLLPDGPRRLRNATALAVLFLAAVVTGLAASAALRVPLAAVFGLAAGLIAIPCADRLHRARGFAWLSGGHARLGPLLRPGGPAAAPVHDRRSRRFLRRRCRSGRRKPPLRFLTPKSVRPCGASIPASPKPAHPRPNRRRPA